MLFIPLLRHIKNNKEALRNLPADMREELIKLEDVIPDHILSPLCYNDPVFNKEKQRELLNKRTDILAKM